jgi:hypothetical protein
VKLSVRHFRRFHEREDFETAFQNHQEEGNPLSRTDFLTKSILWQPVDGQHIIHACKVLAWEAFQRGDITEEIYRERFRTRKARFVVYNKPHLYIGASVQINELHLKRAHYTTVLEDLMKLRAIWEGHGRPSVESRADDKKRSQCLLEAAEAIRMEFKEGQYKGIREVGRRLSDYTKHAWNKDDEAFNLIVQVLSILNDDSSIISCTIELVLILYISCHVNFDYCLDTTYIFLVHMIRCAKTMKKVLFT